MKRFAFKPTSTFVFHMYRPVIFFFVHLKTARLSATDDVAIFLFSFALRFNLELMFQYDRICQLKALPHRVQNVFWQEWDSNPRTHSCTRILDWWNSWVWRLRPLGHPDWFTSTFFSDDMRFFSWVEFAFQRFNLLNGLCHPFEKICVQTHAYFRVSHVLAGYLLLCALINRSAVGHGWRCDFFVSCFGLSCSINVPVWQNLSAEGSASSRSKRFLTGVGFEPTHTLLYQNSRLRIFLSLAL